MSTVPSMTPPLAPSQEAGRRNVLENRGYKHSHQEELFLIHTLLTDLKSCTMKRDLQWGRKIHAKAAKNWHDSNMYVLTALIRMYARCGSMADARRTFDSMKKPDVVSWNVLLLGYAENGDGQSTLELFLKMKACRCEPNCMTYVACLKACTSFSGKSGQAEWLERGREIHSEIGSHLDLFVQSTLTDMYAKFGVMVDARRVFESIQKPNVVCWNALLMGYVENGDGLAALDLFSKMKTCGCAPDSVTYVAAIKSCTSLAGKPEGGGQGEWLIRGKEIHSEIRCRLDIILQNTLIDMYAKCGSMVDARRVFDAIRKPNVVSWNALLLGYVENGEGLTSLELFSRMKECDSVTYIAALKACTSLAGNQDSNEHADCLKWGKEIHSKIGYDLDMFVQNTLIDMYAKCGSMADARSVFDSIQKPSVVSWSALLLGYAENGFGLVTLELFAVMKASGCLPNTVTYIAALKACGLTGALALGRKFHFAISEFTAPVVTCLVDFYAKCGSILEAREVFDAHSKVREVSTWTALLTGYSSFGDTVSVFNLFEAMQDEGFKPNAVTFVCMLSCCSHAGLVEKAREYFEAMPQFGFTPTVMHYTCMIDILGRANQLHEAFSLLRKMPCNPNAVTWMTLLAACLKWKNVEIGRCAFQSLLDIDKSNVAAYVLMDHIYSSCSLWEEHKRLVEARIKLGTC